MIVRCSASDELWQTVTADLEKHRFDGFILDDGKPSAIITSERYEEMWHAILAKCEELQRQPGSHPGMRGTGYLGHDGRSMSCVCEAGHDDGTSSVYHVQAYQQGGHRQDRITVMVSGPWLDSKDQFWAKQAADRDSAVVIAGEHYRVLPDRAPRDRDLAGHGGRLSRIRRLADGQVTETRNLWHQGVIPPKWRDRMPDDAEFVTADSLAATEATS